jgi:hypothetical protein
MSLPGILGYFVRLGDGMPMWWELFDWFYSLGNLDQCVVDTFVGCVCMSVLGHDCALHFRRDIVFLLSCFPFDLLGPCISHLFTRLPSRFESLKKCSTLAERRRSRGGVEEGYWNLDWMSQRMLCSVCEWKGLSHVYCWYWCCFGIIYSYDV